MGLLLSGKGLACQFTLAIRRQPPCPVGYVARMLLYTCPVGKAFGALPAQIAHPCGRAAKALDDAGHSYETKEVKGGTLLLWTLPSRGRDRAEIERLSGQRAVPILLLDDGSVVSGTSAIVSWAHHQAPVRGN
jgi:hypothetical protein